jgi:hypothetical protein
VLQGVVQFYLDGFRNMRLGRTLWKIILLKLLILFAVFKWFLFPDFLEVTYDNDLDRAGHVMNQLTQATPSVNAGNH